MPTRKIFAVTQKKTKIVASETPIDSRMCQTGGSETSVRTNIVIGPKTGESEKARRVLVRPPDASRDDPLNMAVAKVAWDGHVLLNPNASHFATAGDAHRLWPGWRGHP